MPYTLQQLSDLEDIRVLKHRYFRAIDTADAELFAPMFTDDIKVEYRGGDYLVRLTGREAMLEFLLNSFHSETAGMHHGHMPEIEFVNDDEATGIWYLEDIFIQLEWKTITIGSAIYRDVYRRVDGMWKIAETEYDRIMEVVEPLRPGMKLTAHYLAKHGRQQHERGDISHLITWTEKAA